MKIRAVNRTSEDSDAPDFVFFCPGCKCGHGVWTTHPDRVSGATWTFKGTMDAPTFEPSIKIEGVNPPLPEPTTGDWQRGPDGKYLLDAEGRLEGSKPYVCHLHITNGQLIFCADSTHELAGKTVPMVDYYNEDSD